ncbi:TerB family tellurite resistance protein [Mucilaginibacter ximonensis]|uniref:TerB family tellurite resistance protein n=1 Tax=Mucilaginibacter ximonensis TaxID=538021 RepID=A0ABW5Y9I1_9SPHI
MKKLLIISLIFMAQVCKAQSIAQCLEQLSLDYQKLAGLKSILSQMYTGYEVLSKGYGAVKGVAQGNFSINEAFLDGLYVVSPTVRKYPKIAQLISNQEMLVSEIHAVKTASFSPDEVGYMMDVYNNLITQSLNNLSALTMVVTDSQLRMSDAERMGMIDQLYEESKNELGYLRSFNNRLYQTSLIRARQTQDKNNVKSLYGLNP